MINNIDRERERIILGNLKSHLSSLPAGEKCITLPNCHCMKLFKPLIKKQIITGIQVCLYCSSLSGWIKNKKKGCPFI